MQFDFAFEGLVLNQIRDSVRVEVTRATLVSADQNRMVFLQEHQISICFSKGVWPGVVASVQRLEHGPDSLWILFLHLNDTCLCLLHYFSALYQCDQLLAHGLKTYREAPIIDCISKVCGLHANDALMHFE